MTLPRPSKIMIEYEDGDRTTVDYQTLTDACRFELERQPALCRPSPAPDKDKYLIVIWEDGWREVYKVDPACVGLNRYYVISRPEDAGRLSINKADGRPELVEIGRRPLSVRTVVLGESLELTPNVTTREGTKKDHFFKASPNGDKMAEIREEFAQALAEENSVSSLAEDASENRTEILERVRKRMRLNAGNNQQDVLDFLAGLQLMNT